MPNVVTKLLSAVAVHEVFWLSPYFVASGTSCGVRSIYSTLATEDYSHLLIAGDDTIDTTSSSDGCAIPAVLRDDMNILFFTGDFRNHLDYVRIIRECVNGPAVLSQSRGALQPQAAATTWRIFSHNNYPKSIRIGSDSLFASSCLFKHIGEFSSNVLSEFDICSNHLPMILMRLNISQILVVSEFGLSDLPSCDGRIVKVDTKAMADHMLLNTGQGRFSVPFAELVQPPIASVPLYHSMDIDSRNYDHVIVISDLHGDYKAGVQSLCIGAKQVVGTVYIDCARFATKIKTRLARIASGEPLGREPMYPGLRVLVVQMGDIVDRGPNAKDLYLLFDRLEEILGWRTVSVMGNHETMQHYLSSRTYTNGQLPSYVSAEDVLKYGDITKRCAEFSNGLTWERILSKYVMFVRVGIPGAAGGTLFAHGGVELPWIKELLSTDDLSNLHVDEINLEARKVLLQKPAKLDRLFNNDRTGAPFWTRTLSYKNEIWARPTDRTNPMRINYEVDSQSDDRINLLKGALCDDVIDPILEAFQVDRVIVGHTPQEDELVKSKCEGKIILSDVRISRWMHDDKKTPNPMAIVMKVNTDGSINSIVAHYNSKDDAKKGDPLGRVSDFFAKRATAIAVSPALSPLDRIPPLGVIDSQIILPVHKSSTN